ncbi:MAG TPA: energy transducer TonB [Puia sp.]|jgi:hypothetical protein|nr:energy transducer TonB [Puia sp.]
MKTTLFTVIAFITAAQFIPSQQAVAQGYTSEKINYLDAGGNSTHEKKAVLIEQVVQFGDTIWEHNLYRVGRPMFRSARCSDPEGNVLNGHYITYNEVGIVDTFGNYSKGKRTGSWHVYTPQGRLEQELFYRDGELLWTKDTVQLKHESDSMREVFKKDSAGNPAGKTFTKVEIESEFPGGAAGWLRYLNKNLRYPDYAVKYKIMGMVVITFIVDNEGHISPSSIYLTRSVEFNIDHEATRIIFNSPDWTPAIQNGRKVKSYKKQPIVFRLS